MKNVIPFYLISFSFVIFVAILFIVGFSSILQQACPRYHRMEYSTQKESKPLIEREEEEPRSTPTHGAQGQIFDKIIVEPTIVQDEKAKIFEKIMTQTTATSKGEEAKGFESDAIEPAKTQGNESKPAEEKDLGVPFAVGRTEEGCDLFSGKWVYDETRPLYREDCRFISSQFTCQAHGRPDKLYLHWRWLPHGCSLPRFNATFMLERLRGKRFLFVGDSLTRGQFSSMLCLQQRAIPKFAKSHRQSGSLTIYAVPEYNATIEFYWAPFLVQSNCDNASVHRVTDRIVHVYPGSLETHAQHWKGADILVFNTYIWWIMPTKMKIMRRNDQGGTYIRLMEMEEGYRLVLKSMVRWLEENIDPHKTRIIFMTMSPTHYRADWGGDPHGTCYNETTPISNSTYWGSGASTSIMQVVREVLAESKVPITIVNITQLSLHRKDAHTSIYKQLSYKLTPEQQANPISYADCSHWCMPGPQDTWNELLYAKLFFP